MAQNEHVKNTFWACCPKKLDWMPEAGCSLGKAETQAKDTGCKWFVNSETDHYCYWTWLRRVSNKDGFFEPLLQNEISELLNLSNSKINTYLKEAFEKIKTFDDYALLKDLFLD